jgi:hypothetical protein
MYKDEAYRNLSDLIFRGFLTIDATLGDKKVILKTVNDKEFKMIKYHSGSENSKNYLLLFNMYFLAYSTFMIDGKNVLMNREENIYDLKEFFSGIPYKLYEKIVSETVVIRDKAYDATKFLEGFTYTDSSRWSWKTMGKEYPCNTQITGIPGTFLLGINSHQENWVYINRAIDNEEEYNREFDLAILIASASNAKGAKQIRGRHDGSMQNSEDRRKKLAQVGYIDTDKWSQEGWAAPVDTAEELVAELNRQMAGMKDKHDVFMEDYLKSMKDNAELQAKQAEERLKKYRESGDMAMITGSQRILTPKEAENLMRVKKPYTISVKDESQADVESQERYISKIGSKVLTGKK